LTNQSILTFRKEEYWLLNSNLIDLSAKRQARRVISSGSLKLDIALGVGGCLTGSIVEISGASATGKTTLCQHIAAEAQKLGGLAAWIDTDMSFSPAFAQRCGVDLPNLYFGQPVTAEQALDILERLVRSAAFSVIIFDSLQTLVPAIEFKRAQLEVNQARDHELLSACLNHIEAQLSHSNTLVVFTNASDAKMSAIYHRLGEQISRLAIKLHASIRLHLHRLQEIKRGKDHRGARIQARVIKNKFAPCLYTTDFDIIYDRGIDRAVEVFSLAASLHSICQTDNGFYYREVFLGKTPQQALDFLTGDLSVIQALESEIRQKLIPQ
jgi:recombination protein RecA